ncbi:hypothetical protein [Pectinatus frisingensis]|uniref:hypothetical protein n=1 Tax=Pectinatus frisingensis TaxID=865 RepID=UPI0018C7B350|nr:hypothetical protein [Pectinatus frisingensis]
MNTTLTLRCGHNITVNLPDDTKAQAVLIKKYQSQDCPICRRKKQTIAAAEKAGRMQLIMSACKPLLGEVSAVEQAERIREGKLRMLDALFDKTVLAYEFSSDKEKQTFEHYRCRTIRRFCDKQNAAWWLERRNMPVESIIETLKEKSFLIDGRLFQEKK